MTSRKLSNEEMADLPNKWENCNIDTSKYYINIFKVWEVNKSLYLECRKDGLLCQIFNGKFYVGE